MKLGEIFMGNYYTGAGLTKPVLLTVAGGAIEELGDSKDRKWVVRFSETEMGCVLNVTRGQAMEEITGSDDTDKWPGHKVVLYRGQTTMGGKSMACVAVRAPKNGAAQPEPAPAIDDDFNDDDVPF